MARSQTSRTSNLTDGSSTALPTVTQGFAGSILKDTTWEISFALDGSGQPLGGQTGIATDGQNFYTIGRGDPKIRRFDLGGRYLEDAGLLRDSEGLNTSQIGIATDGRYFYTIAARDYRIRAFDLSGQFLGDVVRFHHEGTPDLNNTGIAAFPPLPTFMLSFATTGGGTVVPNLRDQRISSAHW